jgi:hypothetical protein
VTRYDKSPDYGGPEPGRWTAAIWLPAIITAAATIYFLSA